jgi:hypothetical protein
MNHLNAGELVDLIERSPDLSRARYRHAETCAHCRAKADALRSIAALAAAEEVPAPSPLFWDHFSARVGEAIREERFGDAPRIGWRSWLTSGPRWTAMAATVAVVTSIVVWRATVYAPVPVSTPRSAAVETHGEPAAALDPSTLAYAAADADDDAAWAIVRAAADDLPWEDAHAAGLSARPGAAEGLALEMTADERQELARLLGQELKRNGV